MPVRQFPAYRRLGEKPEADGMGMRIENAYIVGENGCELITDGIPSDPDGIERLMAQAMAEPAASSVRSKALP